MARPPVTVLAPVALLPAAAAWSRTILSTRRAAPGEVGNDACATCHRSIYDSYMLTAMARASGPVLPNPH